MTPASPERTAQAGAWLSELHGRAREWVTDQRLPNFQARTEEYVDLLFAFGQARLGQRVAAQELLSRAAGALGGEDEAHQTLLGAFRFRIEQALRGEPHRGPLPGTWHEASALVERLAASVIDRARKHLRVLEPDRRVNPYRHWGARISDFEGQLASLHDIVDPPTFTARVEQLKLICRKGKRGEEDTGRVLEAALSYASVATAQATQGWLGEAAPRLLEQPIPAEPSDLAEFLRLAANSVQAASHHRLCAEFLRSVRVLPRLLAGSGVGRGLLLDELLCSCVRGFIAFNLPDELDSFLGEVTPRLTAITQGDELTRLCLMARIAEGWYAFGWGTLARPALRQALGLLPSLSGREVGSLACALAGAVRTAAADEARTHYLALLKQSRVADTYTSGTHFTISQLEVIDAIVLSAVEAFLND